jgi:S-adenosylmethionine:tRNA ribosyltransferase-isomerase
MLVKFYMLLTADLHFDYPDELVALVAKSRGTSRILKIPRQGSDFKEITWQNLLSTFKSGDTLVLNDSQVLWARLPATKSTGKKGEIFFLRKLTSNTHWEVLSRALNLTVGSKISLPGGLEAEVLKSGRICEITLSREVVLKDYFLKYGEVPLPPYIISLREKFGDHKKSTALSEKVSDQERYQNVWAREWGSVAAPTAGLHFSNDHLDSLRKLGVKICYVTLHVGAGTFLPIETKTLKEFQIHAEVVNVSTQTCAAIRQTQAQGKKVWACGTTAARALESAVWASGTAESKLPMIVPFFGETRLYITPGYKFRVVDALLTNFHQPQSSLLALVAAFSTFEPARSVNEESLAVAKILSAYDFGIQKKFRLFSYGDLTVME